MKVKRGEVEEEAFEENLESMDEDEDFLDELDLDD
jgi:hypothetical protein